MPKRRRRCVCAGQACALAGDEPTIRLPKVQEAQDIWLKELGVNPEQYTKTDGRVCLVHFAASSILSKKTAHSVLDVQPNVVLKKNAVPSQTPGDIKEAARGSLGDKLRWEAVARDLKDETLRQTIQISGLKEDNVRLTEELARARKELQEARRSSRESRETSTEGRGAEGGRATDRGQGISYTILKDLNPLHSRSLCGFNGLGPLKALYDAVNYSGAADAMVFYGEGGGGVDEQGKRPAKRKKTFRGVNGLFFVLFILRTGVPLVVASSLFGVHETTGGRGFTTWLKFLAARLRPFVRLPDVEEVKPLAPPNFKARGLSGVILVLDATEIEMTRTWQSDIAYVLWSEYKQRPTGKIMVGITHAGAICHVSYAFGGRLSDSEVVRESGLVEELIAKGFGGGRGFSVMVDRGFNPVGFDLAHVGITLVVPPGKRGQRDEVQFNEEDAEQTRTTANLRIHVERAIGAMKEWHILKTKFSSKQMDLVDPCVQVCACLVNMTREYFASDK